MSEDNKKIEIPAVITVKEFAERANLPVTAVITELMKNGVLATINETIDFETASIIGEYLGFEVVIEEIVAKSTTAQGSREVAKSANMIHRPPVVTIMGHVDHGKTTLMDSIRKAHVAASESGGITQHISAYQVTLSDTKNKNLKNKTITLIDTPGHAAFSTMREHGTAITDIIVLIVAANDGVMPQTAEVIEQAKANNVPIIVALNKVELPDADVMRVKTQLSEHGLVPEDWGGKTIMVEVSAKQDSGIDDLLEMVLLQAEIMELKADPNQKAMGVVIESHMQKGAGAMATILIENGTVHRGEPIAVGSAYGRVRILEDFKGASIDSAGPSMPVRIAGLKSLPDFGDRLLAFSDEKEARETALLALKIKPSVNIASAKRIGEKDEKDQTIEIKELRILLKCDVAGSLEAVKQTLNNIHGEDFHIKIIADGVGTITESDVTLAEASKALVIGFRVNIFGAAKRIAEKDNVSHKLFQVIYELVDFVKASVVEILPPIVIEQELGHGKVLAIFRDDKKGFVAGGIVESGKISNGDEIKFLQNNPPAGGEKFKTKILSLRKEKNEAKEVESGTECGFSLSAGANVAVGDDFVAFKTIYEKRKVE